LILLMAEFEPPQGHWIDPVDNGLPLVRIICEEITYGLIVTSTKIKTSTKLLLLIVVVAMSIFLDHKVHMVRYYQETIYDKLDVHRSANLEQIDSAISAYE